MFKNVFHICLNFLSEVPVGWAVAMMGNTVVFDCYYLVYLELIGQEYIINGPQNGGQGYVVTAQLNLSRIGQHFMVLEKSCTAQGELSGH